MGCVLTLGNWKDSWSAQARSPCQRNYLLEIGGVGGHVDVTQPCTPDALTALFASGVVQLQSKTQKDTEQRCRSGEERENPSTAGAGWG